MEGGLGVPGKLTLKCLGAPQLSGPSGREVPFRSKKHLALLVYLAVEDRGYHRRGHLAELFWPDVPERMARTSLATALSAIRRRLGDRDALEGSADRVRLRPGILALDLDLLLADKVIGEDWTPAIEVAGFLEGLELSGLTDFHHWQDRQRARLLPAIVRGLVALTDLARRTGDVGQLGKLADRLLAINELSEEGVRARMESAAMSGDRITALRSYEYYEKRLQGELEAKPSVTLERMAIRLRRRGWERPLDSPEPSVRTEQWQDRPFVGRAREYRVLYELWERARDGRAEYLLILGESGVGKTTLADRFATAASLEGAQVARARGYELERGIPFAMIGAMLRVLLDRPGVAATSPAALAELARIVPEIAGRFPNLPPVPEALGESARIRFAESLLEFTLCLTAEQPLVLVVDDLQQVDDASLAALHFVMRRVAQHPLVVLLAARPTHADETPAATRIREAATQQVIGTLELGPMSQQEAEALLDALVTRAPRVPTGVERQALLRAGAGFPLAIELLLRTWQDNGHDLSFLSLDTMTVAVARGPEATYSRLAESALRQLQPNQLMVLHLAAILDRRLGELGMYRLVDFTPTQAVAEMMVLSARRILRDAGQRMEFVNPAIRAHAYLSIPGTLRQVLHSGVADDLLARHARGERIPGLELAWHCVRAGRVEEGRPFILSGAREALDQGAPYEVELALTTGMDLLHENQKPAATLLLAETLGESGRWMDALDLIACRTELAEPEHQPDADALVLLCRIRIEEPNADTQTAILERAMHIFGSATSPQARVHAATAGVVACSELRDSEATKRLLHLLEPHLEQFDQPAHRSQLLLSLATLSSHSGDSDRALSLVMEAGHLARAAGLKSSLRARIENGTGAALCAAGRYSDAIPYLHAAIEMWQALGNDILIRAALNNLALCYSRLGRYREQLETAALALRLPRGDKGASEVLFTYHHAAMACGFLGLTKDAQQHLDAALSVFSNSGVGWLRQRVHMTAADVLWLVGRQSRSIEFGRAFLGNRPFRALAPQFTGAFARWAAVLLRFGRAPDGAQDVIEAAGRLRHELDLVDRLEVLSALSSIRELTAEEWADRSMAASALPPTVIEQLAMLGLPG